MKAVKQLCHPEGLVNEPLRHIATLKDLPDYLPVIRSRGLFVHTSHTWTASTVLAVCGSWPKAVGCIGPYPQVSRSKLREILQGAIRRDGSLSSPSG